MTVILAIESSCDETGVGICELADDGTVTLADALRVNNTLEFINLRGNGITDVGGAALLQAIQPDVNKSVTAVWYRLNHISEELQAKLLEVLVLKCPPPPEPVKKKKGSKKKGAAAGTK